MLMLHSSLFAEKLNARKRTEDGRSGVKAKQTSPHAPLRVDATRQINSIFTKPLQNFSDSFIAMSMSTSVMD